MKIPAHFIKSILRAIGVLVLLGPLSVLAQSKVVVIPLGEDSNPVNAGVGTQITSAPYTITAPGFYYLGRNLNKPIYVNSSNVTLDLMGFTITGSGSGSGIAISGGMGGLENVEIRNGTVRNFSGGISAYSAHPPEMGHRIINVRAMNNEGSGIHLAGSGHIIRGCTAVGNDTGIHCSNSLLINNVSTSNSTNLSGAGNTLVGNLF